MFTLVDTGEPIGLVFPYGFSGRVVDHVAELVYPSGAVLAREGEIVSGLMGEAADSGDVILCFDAVTAIEVEPLVR